jgi:hypothetical protein
LRPDPRFVGLDKTFWAHVRSVSQTGGYTQKGGRVRTYTAGEIVVVLERLWLQSAQVFDRKTTAFGQLLVDYFDHRADVLNNYVPRRLMNAEEARALYTRLHARLAPRCPLPKNKQKGKKAGPAFLTGIVNMVIEANCDGLPVNYNPLQLTTVTRNGVPLRTLSRRVDGCFPSPVNPIGLWEIKEYYFTTTFGSRIADGVYETLLDGMEIEELQAADGDKIDHLLIVDAYDTWWSAGGRPYLCRLIDMLHMGYVDEILFGKEVVDRLPEIVAEWVAENRRRDAAKSVKGRSQPSKQRGSR